MTDILFRIALPDPTTLLNLMIDDNANGLQVPVNFVPQAK